MTRALYSTFYPTDVTDLNRQPTLTNSSTITITIYSHLTSPPLKPESHKNPQKHLSSAMPPRIPTADDFAPLATTLPHTLHFPSPPESTTTILILFHGLGDSHASFSSFASGMNLPGVLAITVRGVSPLPFGVGPDDGQGQGWHWGDDVVVDQRTGRVGDDVGYEKAKGLVMDTLVKEVLLEKCGWEYSDIMLFGFGQGGSLALGLSSSLRTLPRISLPHSQTSIPPTFKGVVSVGGPLPYSMIPTVSSREKSKTKVCVVQLGEDKVDGVKREFDDVRVVNWKRPDLDMPKNREEMFPIMKFLADRLNSGWA